MSKVFVQVAVRMSPELHEAIKTTANEKGRSMNTEIILRLEQTQAGNLSVEQHAMIREIHAAVVEP